MSAAPRRIHLQRSRQKLHLQILDAFFRNAKKLAIQVHDQGRFGVQLQLAALAEANLGVRGGRAEQSDARHEAEDLPAGQVGGVNVVEQAVVQAGAGGHHEATFAAADQQAEHEGWRGDGGLLVPSQGHPGGAVVAPEGTERREAVEGDALQAVELAGFEGDAAVEAEAEIADEEAFAAVRSADAADIDGAHGRRRGGGGGGRRCWRGGLGVRRGFVQDAVGVVVGGANGDDGEADVGALGLEEAVGDFVDGAVAAGGGDNGEASQGGAARQLDGVARGFGGLEDGAITEATTQPGEASARSILAGAWVEDDAQIAVHGVNILSRIMPSARAEGFLVIDKPIGITSRAAVDAVQAWFPPGTRIGHAGTLDPLATGVLVIGVGRATRLIEYVQRMDKVYRAGVVLGGVSATDDAEGPISAVGGVMPPSAATIQEALPGFVGDIEQVPPAFSAAHLEGKRAYALARRGKAVELAPRRVTIHELEVLGYEFPRLEMLVRCGKGTYVRSLARDLGRRLGCGAYLESLQRTHIGDFDLGQALALGTSPEEARGRLLPLCRAVAALPALVLSEDALHKLALGQSVPCDRTELEGGSNTGVGEVAVLDDRGELRALALFQEKGRRLQPMKVFLTESE